MHAPETANTNAEALPRWNLADLYDAPDGAALAADLARADAQSATFQARYQGKLAGLLAANGGAALATALDELADIYDVMGRLGAYGFLRYVTATDDPARAKFFGDVRDKLTAGSARLVFFGLEVNRLDDAALDAAAASGPLARYRPWLDDLRIGRPYDLPEEIERLFHEKSATSGAFSRLFNETMTALRFRVGGEDLPIEPVLDRMMSPDEAVRREAGEALAEVFAKNVRLFTLITNTLAKDKEISNRWRGFPDIASGRHMANQVEPEVVDALLRSVKAAYPRLSHRYYAMKARWLGKERLEYWDRNAPIDAAPMADIGWAEAKETVLDAYREFSPKMAEIAEGFFTKSWIDAPTELGKQQGAFAHPVVPSAHPYVMLNYLGKPRDVMTLAHELGHGVHQVLANAQGPLMAGTPLTLAETASVFGEMLTFQALLKRADGPARRTLLAQKVEDKLNTVVRQIAFYDFERRIHTARAQGELTPDDIAQHWLAVQGESLGPALHFAPGYENFWCYVSHFIHSPFYVYAYAFGDCLVNSLYAVYEKADAGFAERYLDMLQAGGTKRHKELLAPFGLDAGDPEFWNHGLGLIERMIDELEALDEMA